MHPRRNLRWTRGVSDCKPEERLDGQLPESHMDQVGPSETQQKKHCHLGVDCYKSHITDDVLHAMERANASVVFLPGGCTSKACPVDASLNRPIKDTVRGMWEGIATSNMAQGPVSETPAISNEIDSGPTYQGPCTT